jgi:hypothetical protein
MISRIKQELLFSHEDGYTILGDGMEFPVVTLHRQRLKAEDVLQGRTK